jgi:hypothetical protein
MTAAADDQPPNSALGAIDRFAEALGELLEKRALSVGLVEVAVEVDGWFIDSEVMFSTDPDMGISVDVQRGVARYCELVGEDSERWLDHEVRNLPILEARGDEERREIAIAVLGGVLDARRPLLPKDDSWKTAPPTDA